MIVTNFVRTSYVIKDGNVEPSACTSSEWNRAQSSILAKRDPVITFGSLLIGMRQSDREPDQSKGPLQSETVVNIAIHLN